MTKREFTEKLTPFFSHYQIEHLDRVALESAQDAGETHEHGRDVIALWIADTADNPSEMYDMLGINMAAEVREALIKQLDIEW